MHRLSLLPTLLSIPPRASFLTAALSVVICSTLSAQLRQDAVKAPPTKTSPSAFRPLSSQPLDERTDEKKSLLAQNAPTPQPVPTPVPTGPATPGTPTVPGGPGGFGARPRGGFGGFATPNADAETFKIEGDKVSLQFP